MNPKAERDPHGTRGDRVSRRRLLASTGIAAGGLAAPSGVWLPSARAETAGVARGFGSGRALRVAMHVHGPWSEQEASWEAQFDQAASNGYDVLYLTDHDYRAMALDYITSLDGIDWDPVVITGRLAQRAAGVQGGSFHLLAESAEELQPASVTLPIQEKPLAWNRFRTSVSGLSIKQRVGSVRLREGARYEVVIPLSHHPAMAGRPAGQYELVYRFGSGVGRRWQEGDGLTGVVAMPIPARGSTQTLVPTQDIAAIWPEMVAIDNGTYGLSFRAKSPRRGATCEVTIDSVRFTRSRSSAASVIADQAEVLATYTSRTSVAAHQSIEIGRGLPHMNPFGIPPWLPDYAALSSDPVVFRHQVSGHVHGMGGLISYNHPFGANGGPLLSRADQIALRRQVFTEMQTVGRFGVDILEVGYNLRGNVDCPTHLDLWDTFSRNGDFLTGNGVADDHHGRGWATLNNGFATGVWAASTDQADLVSALAAGRAFTAHAERWPGDLDLLVDGSVPMGAVSVSRKPSRSLAIWATDLPTGSAVQVVAGPVDYAGHVNPGTSVLRTLTPSSFSGNLATIAVDTSRSRFYRVQVLLDRTGQTLGTSNPVWLLRVPPPGGIPPARDVR